MHAAFSAYDASQCPQADCRQSAGRGLALIPATAPVAVRGKEELSL
jgi:hypothetical protein